MKRQSGYYWVKVKRKFHSSDKNHSWIVREWYPYDEDDTDIIEIT